MVLLLMPSGPSSSMPPLLTFHFMYQVYHHALHLRETLGLQRHHLYRDIVGGWLRTYPRHAWSWHEIIRGDAMMPKDPAIVIFPHVLHSRNSEAAYSLYRKIYLKTGASAMYDRCMPLVCDLCDFSTALRWHAFFTKHGDNPSAGMLSRPIIRHLSARHSLPDRQFKHEDLAARQKFVALQIAPAVQSRSPLLSSGSVDTTSKAAPTIKQKEMGDAFCARLFATGSFSINLVTSGLRMIGLETLGSLALREIAARVHDLPDYLSTIKSLESSGLTIADSTFSRALRKFAEEGSSDYFDVLVRSDQHPDTYDDRRVQRHLFASFLSTGEVVQAHATLAVLTMSRRDPEGYTWNLLLRTYCETSSQDHVLQILGEMRLKNIPLSRASLDAIFYRFLRIDRWGMHKLENARKLDFVSNVFLQMLRSGQGIAPTRWRELLRRYGLTRRFVVVERLSLWLATLYRARSKATHTSAVRLPQEPIKDLGVTYSEHGGTLQPLAQIFSSHFLRAVVSWGFIASVIPEQYEREIRVPFPMPPLPPETSDTTRSKVKPRSWAKGIAIVRQLKDYGVDIAYSEVRREVKLRLWMIFGPGRSAKKHNRLAQRRNRQSLEHYVRHINEVWGGNFFLLPQDTLERVARSDDLTFNAIFGHTEKYVYHQDGVDGSNNASRIRLRRSGRATLQVGVV